MRVCEDVCRFVLGDGRLAGRLKSLRHATDELIRRSFSPKQLLAGRDSAQDPGRRLHCPREMTRRGCPDILGANLQRAKESMRVLEEFSKLLPGRHGADFQELRYRIYDIEKLALCRLLEK